MTLAPDDVLRQLGAARVVPVIVLDDVAAARPLADALAEGGLCCAEVTLRTSAAVQAIGPMTDRPGMLVGAGTVLDAAQAEAAAAAGASFIVSPGFDQEVVAACRHLGVLALPGAVTPTEVQRARRAGLRAVKFFPAEALGGIRVVAALAAPFPDIRFVPTGGITAGNLQSYLAHEAVLAVGGSWMVPRRLLAAAQWEHVTRLAAEASRLLAA